MKEKWGKCVTDYTELDYDTLYYYMNNLDTGYQGMSREDRKVYIEAQKKYFRYECFLK